MAPTLSIPIVLATVASAGTLAMLSYDGLCLALGSRAVSVVLCAVLFVLPFLVMLRVFYRDIEMIFLFAKLKIAMIIYAKRLTVPDFWERFLPSRRNNDFIVFDGRTYTYEQVDKQANLVKRRLFHELTVRLPRGLRPMG